VPDILVSAGGSRFGAEPCQNPWTVQMIPSYELDGVFLAEYVAENHPGKSVAILWENDTVGQDGSAGVKRTLDPASNPIIAEESYEYTAVSIASEVANLAKSKADVLVLNANLGFTAQAIITADRLGWHPQLVMPYINGDDLVFNFVKPELMKGAVATDANKLIGDKDTDPAVAKHVEILKNYSDNVTPSNFTMYAQVLGELAVDILSRTCDNLTREGLMSSVESLTNYQSELTLPGVTITISKTDHVGFENMKFLRAKIVDGKGVWEYEGELMSFR
jgi:branched-chain amino acid transport system substrate-binding protein